MERTDGAKLAHQETPDEGHTFRITVTTRGASRVMGDKHARDSDWWSDPWEIEVREHSLASALRKAARVPFAVWADSAKHEEPHRTLRQAWLDARRRLLALRR
jgi:hypothetical protein